VASQLEKIAIALEMLEGAEASVRSAKQILLEVTGNRSGSKRQRLHNALSDLNAPSLAGQEKIIEGVFDGEKMVGSDKNEYAVPANYASKSKLVPGDVLKLTIKNDGSFMYKQISPVERKHILGTLTYDNGAYKVLAAGKLYKILYASVTYYRGEVGDRVSLIVPASGSAEWGAVDAIIPAASSEKEAAAAPATAEEAPAAPEAPAPAAEEEAPKAKTAKKTTKKEEKAE